MDDNNKKCFRDVLVKELNDLKVRAKMLEEAFKEDDEDVSQKLKEIYEKDKSINESIMEERKKLKRKINIFAPIFVSMTPFYMIFIASIVSQFNISIEIALSLVCVTSMILVPSSYLICCNYLRNKCNRVIFSYMKKKQLLKKDEEEYLDIIHCSEDKYINAYSLVLNKEKEIAKLDDREVTYELGDNKDKNIVEERPYTRKLERK